MLTEDLINKAHKEATVQIGARKGFLKKTCPPMGTLAAAYWMGVMFVVNPLKLSMSRMIFWSDDEKMIFLLSRDASEKIFKKNAGLK